MDVLAQVQQALADLPAYGTDLLNQLNQACGNDRCHRRERIIYQLQRYAAQHAVNMGAPSTTHKFKRDFAQQTAPIEVDGVTKGVTASNLTDEDVPLLRQYGYGHFLEELPKPETPAEDDEAEPAAETEPDAEPEAATPKKKKH